MKTLLNPFYLLILLMLAGCQTNQDSNSTNSLVGKWQLVKLESGQPRLAGADTSLPYQEIYEFNADSTFRKYRPDGTEAKGTYTNKQIEGQEYIEASFDQKEASSGCVEGKSHLQPIGADTIIEDNLACDGPKLYYQRMKNKE